MSETGLVLYSADSGSISLTPEFRALIADALHEAEQVTCVRTPAENEVAARVGVHIQEVIKRIEEAHRAAKAPYLDMCRKLDDLKREATEELQFEKQRLLNLSASYYSQEQTVLQTREQARARRVEEIEAELNAAIMAAKNDEERRAAHERARQQLESLEPLDTPQPKGHVLSEVWDYEIVDLAELARTHQHLVELTPRRREIREEIERQAALGLKPELPGLKITRKMQVKIRL